jgi:Ca-activated chloride channel family protein
MDGAFGLDRPGILLALILLFVFALIQVIRDRKHPAFTAPFAFRYRFSRFMFWVFCAALIIALAGPRWGLRYISEYHRGLDMALALDMSHSMEVRDLGPSRLERATALGRELAELPGFRLALALGRGRGSLTIPLTDDRSVILSLLESLEGALYTGAGTNLESLVDAASSAFSDDSPGRRLIVLLSDGEALSGALADAARRARARGVAIAAVGLGTEAGGAVPLAVPVTPASAAASTASLAESGEALISQLRREALEEAAGLSGGIYLDGADPLAGARLGAFVESLSVEKEGVSRRRENRSRWRFFLCVALAVLALSKLSMRRFIPQNLALFLLFPLLPLCQSCVPVSGKLLVVEGNFYHSQGLYDEAIEAYTRALGYPETLPYAEYGLGTVYAALDEAAAALGRYDAAAEALPAGGETGELAYRLYYNRGLALFWIEDFRAAAAAFRRALEIDGGRIEAKRNLELSLLSLTRENSPSGEEGREGGGGDPRQDALFRYLNLKEQNQWKSREWIEEPSSGGPDY